MLCPFAICYGHLEFVMAIWYTCWLCIWYIFPVLVCCTKNNLATLVGHCMAIWYTYLLVIWYIFPVLVCCTNKNLATLVGTENSALIAKINRWLRSENFFDEFRSFRNERSFIRLRLSDSAFLQSINFNHSKLSGFSQNVFARHRYMYKFDLLNSKLEVGRVQI
jgi:hypothetical protein